MPSRMSPGRHERRQFDRVATNLTGLVDRELPVAIRVLSSGGCLIETIGPLRVKPLMQLEFDVAGEAFSLTARLINAPRRNRAGLRFEVASPVQPARLAAVVQRLQQAPAPGRPTRLRIVKGAHVDRKPTILTDLGMGGCFLRTAEPYRVGDRVELRCLLGRREICLAARVRWRSPVGIGVQYLAPDEAQLEQISEFIAKHQPRPSLD